MAEAVGTAILTAINAGGAATATVFGSVTVASVVGYVATTALSGAVMRHLAPDIGSITGNQGRLISGPSSVASQQYVYGQIRKGGTIVFMDSSGQSNKYLHTVIALAGHECEEIGDIYVNDEIVTLDADGYVTGDTWKSKIRVLKHDGTQTSATDNFTNAATNLADTLIADTSADISFVGQGIAYLYTVLERDGDVFAGGVPQITAVMKGRKVYDPRTTSTAYSNNAALCIRDYITADFGWGDGDVDDTYFVTAANDCDDDITLAAGGTQKRYTIDGIVDASQTRGDIVSDMMTACSGELFRGSGKWKLKVGVFTASVASLDLDDLRGGINLQTRTGIADGFNAISGKFVFGGKQSDGGGDWIETEYTAIQSQTFVDQDGGQENTLDFALPFTTDPTRAERLAKLTLYRSREQMTLTAEFGLGAASLEVGDTVDLTVSKYGWTAKLFEVVEWRLLVSETEGVRVALTLRETSADAYDWNAEETAFAANDTTLPDFTTVPAVGVALSDEARILSEKLLNVLLIDVSATPSDLVDYVEVEYKLTSDSTFTRLSFGELGLFELIDASRAEYDVRARAVNVFGVKGEYTTVSGFQVSATDGPPADVTGFGFEVIDNSLILRWTPVADLDLSYYAIRHSVETSGASWSGATTAEAKIARPGVSHTLPLRAGTYHIRSYDKGGIPSQNYTSVVVGSEYLPTYATTTTQSDAPAFSGTKTGVSVSSSALRLTAPVSANDSGTYEFSNYIDTTSARMVWARVKATVARVDDGTGTFDELAGDLDSLEGLFDDLGGGRQVADQNVTFEIATTTDDPSGSPTWSDWLPFRAGNFYGRAFKFRVTLTTEADDITPNITALDAVVEY